MSDVRWDMLAQYPNPGQAFSQAFQEGQKQAEERRAKEAIAALVGNPQDPKALETAARYDPKLVIDLRQQQAEASIKQVEQYRDQIKIGAQLVRQIQPKDQAGWEQVLNAARQYRINPDQLGVPRQFDPSYVQSLVGLADALEPKNQAQDPSFIREADALGIPRDEAARLWKQKQGMVVINGIPHMAVPGTDQPAPVLTDEDILRMKGGQSGGSSAGGFQDPLAPL